MTIAQSNLLFVTYGGGHVNMVIPVLKRLWERKGLNCVILGLTTAAAALANNELPSRGFASLLRKQDDAARRWGERLTADLSNDGVVNREESIAYLGLSYADLEKREGVEKAARLFAEKGRQAFLPLGPLRRLFDEVRPDLVVTTNSPRAEQAALAVARERGIPSICLVDLFAIEELPRLAAPRYADRLCVLSEGVAERLIAAGRAPAEVVVTGNTAFDALNSQAALDQAETLRRPEWRGGFVILWASQPEPARHPRTGEAGDPAVPERIRHHLYSLLERHPDWHLVVRPHPSETTFSESLPERTTLSGREQSVAALMHCVDAVVTMTSTVGLEAALLGIPVITPEMSVFSPACPYAEYGFALPVSDLNGLEASLEKVQRGKWRPRHPGVRPGEATGKVLSVIEELLDD